MAHELVSSFTSGSEISGLRADHQLLDMLGFQNEQQASRGMRDMVRQLLPIGLALKNNISFAQAESEVAQHTQVTD